MPDSNFDGFGVKAATMRWFSLEMLELYGILDPGFPFGVFFIHVISVYAFNGNCNL